MLYPDITIKSLLKLIHTNIFIINFIKRVRKSLDIHTTKRHLNHFWLVIIVKVPFLTPCTAASIDVNKCSQLVSHYTI